VAVKIEHAVYQSAKMFGRHFDDKDELLSHITRQSIDVLKVGLVDNSIRRCILISWKTTFKADVPNEEWVLIRGLKTVRYAANLKSFSLNCPMKRFGIP